MEPRPDAERPWWCDPDVWNSPDLVRLRRLTALISARARDETPHLEHGVTDPKRRRPPIPALLAPHGQPTITRRRKLHPQTFSRLVREHDRLCRLLEELPTRRTWPGVQARLETQFRNRLTRIRRQLGLQAQEPPCRDWHRISTAARVLGISTKTLLRWEQAGLVESHRAGNGAHRYFADADLRRLRVRLRD